jgi:hypothetical protein
MTARLFHSIATCAALCFSCASACQAAFDGYFQERVSDRERIIYESGHGAFSGMDAVSLARENTPAALPSFPGYSLIRRGNSLFLLHDGREVKLGAVDSFSYLEEDWRTWPEAAALDIDGDGVPEFFLLAVAAVTDASYYLADARGDTRIIDRLFPKRHAHLQHTVFASSKKYTPYPHLRHERFGPPDFDARTRTLTLSGTSGAFRSQEMWRYENGRYLLREQHEVIIVSSENFPCFLERRTFDDEARENARTYHWLTALPRAPLTLVPLMPLPLLEEPEKNAQPPRLVPVGQRLLVTDYDVRGDEAGGADLVWLQVFDGQTGAQGWCLVDLLIPSIAEDGALTEFFPGNGGNRSVMLIPTSTPLPGYEKNSLRIAKTQTDAQGVIWVEVRDARGSTYKLRKQDYWVAPRSAHK